MGMCCCEIIFVADDHPVSIEVKRKSRVLFVANLKVHRLRQPMPDRVDTFVEVPPNEIM